MTGYDVYVKAMILLGYTDQNGNVEGGAASVRRALEAVNQIMLDISETAPLKTVFDPIELPERQQEALIYGVAMLLALGDGDSGKNRVFCELYNMKRAFAKAKKEKISDKLPSVFEG